MKQNLKLTLNIGVRGMSLPTRHLKRFFSYFSLSTVLILVCTWATASPHANKGTQLIERVLHHHVKILHAFPAPDNLVGYIVQAGKGKPTIIYADKQGHYILFGALFDHNGKNLTALALLRFCRFCLGINCRAI